MQDHHLALAGTQRAGAGILDSQEEEQWQLVSFQKSIKAALQAG